LGKKKKKKKKHILQRPTLANLRDTTCTLPEGKRIRLMARPKGGEDRGDGLKERGLAKRAEKKKCHIKLFPAKEGGRQCLRGKGKRLEGGKRKVSLDARKKATATAGFIFLNDAKTKPFQKPRKKSG